MGVKFFVMLNIPVVTVISVFTEITVTINFGQRLFVSFLIIVGGS
jgi:hypothetical protein